MKNTFKVKALYPTGETIIWENVHSIVSNLGGYLMSYTDKETGEYKQHQFEHWLHARISLIDPK